MNRAPVDDREMKPGEGGSSAPDPKGMGAEDRSADRVEVYRERGYEIADAERLSDITTDNTCYRVDGELMMDGYHELQSVEDIAVVGVSDDARLVVPEGFRGYALIIRNGVDFVWSGVDIDQRAPDAVGRVYVAVEGGAVFEDFDHLGGGAPENPHPDRAAIESGPLFYLPATNPNGVNIVRNWNVVFEGVFPNHHFGNRAMGFWSGPAHHGTIRLTDSHLESIPNNAIYGTASPGSYEVENCTFRDNGVTCGGRFAHGFWKNCDIEFDATNTTLQNADTESHAVVGLAAEQKKAGANDQPGPDIIDCNIRMVNSPKGGVAARAYDIYQPSDFGKIVNSEFHVGENTGGWDADIEIEGCVEEIRGCEFSGSNDQYASIVNTSGRRVVMDNCTWEYPEPRKRDKGNVVWR